MTIGGKAWRYDFRGGAKEQSSRPPGIFRAIPVEGRSITRDRSEGDSAGDEEEGCAACARAARSGDPATAIARDSLDRED